MDILNKNNSIGQTLIERPKKRDRLKLLIACLLALILTIFLYWPLYQKIPLDNSKSSINTEISTLSLPLGEDIREILDRKIDLPNDRHELCLKNENKVYLLHADSNTPGVPFIFATDDIARQDYGKQNNIGAMAIDLYYNNSLSKNDYYREVGQPRLCVKLDTNKLQDYASSTIVYRHVGLNRLEELDLGTQGKLRIMRSIVGGSFIDTSNSSAYIIARWQFFFITLVVLFTVLLAFINWLLKKWRNIFPILAKFFKKEKTT